jgi:hypothetical protein
LLVLEVSPEHAFHGAFGGTHDVRDARVAIDGAVEHRLDAHVGGGHCRGKAHQHTTRTPDLVGRSWPKDGQLRPGLGDDIGNHRRYQPAHELGAHPIRRKPRIFGANGVEGGAEQGRLGELAEVDETSAHAVVDVVCVVGDVVGDGRSLGLWSSVGGEPEVMPARVFRNRERQALCRVSPHRVSCGIGQRPVVLDESLEGFPGQVQSVEARVASLEERDHPEALRVVIEPPV